MSSTISMWINIGVVVCSALDGAASQFTTLFGQGSGQKFMAGIGLAGVILGAINAQLHAAKGTQP